MPTVLRAQVNIPRNNAVPADDVINTWHFRTIGTVTPTEGAALVTEALTTFYQAVDVLLAGYVGNADATIKVYNLADDEPRVPIVQDVVNISPGSGLAFPAEVAICLSYRGELLSGTNPARRRGRIFLGPIDADAGTTGDNDTAVAGTARTTIANAATAVADFLTEGEIAWVVFSPTNAGSPPWSEGTLIDASVDVVAGYIDNAFDTIRSRGSTTTARTLWSLTSP